jgi:hypothetical protein
MGNRVIATVGVVLLIVTACTAANDESASTSTVTTASTTTSPASSTTSGPSTTTAPSSTSTSTSTSTTTTQPGTTSTTDGAATFHPVVPIRLAPPDPLPGSDGASGSGCAPGGDVLPDGVWFVFATEVLPDSIRADLACFWFGDIAYEVGEAAGEEVENEFFIGNDSDRERIVPVAADATVWTLAGDTTEGHSAVDYGDWPNDDPGYVDCPGDFCTIWLFINDGRVTDIVEQYIP